MEVNYCVLNVYIDILIAHVHVYVQIETRNKTTLQVSRILIQKQASEVHSILWSVFFMYSENVAPNVFTAISVIANVSQLVHYLKTQAIQLKQTQDQY